MERRARLRTQGLELLFAHRTLLPELWDVILELARATSLACRLRLRRVCKAWWALDGEIVFRLTAAARYPRGSALVVGVTTNGLYCEPCGAGLGMLKPLVENHDVLLQFTTRSDALALGECVDALTRRLAILFYWLQEERTVVTVQGGTYAQWRAIVMAIHMPIGVAFRESDVNIVSFRPTTYGDALHQWLNMARENFSWGGQLGRLSFRLSYRGCHYWFQLRLA